MKLHELITEQNNDTQQLVDQAVQQIVRDCKPFVDELKGGQHGLVYRGTKDANDLFIKQQIRKDRKPMDTPQIMHDAADEWFIEHFNYPYRSAGLFTTGSIQEAKEYGSLYAVFPIGNYNYIWSPHYDLLFVQMDQAYDVHLADKMEPSQGDAYQIVSEILDEGDYKHNQDLINAISSGNEILFAADQFYGIRVKPGYGDQGIPNVGMVKDSLEKTLDQLNTQNQ